MFFVHISRCLHCKPLMVSFHNIHDFEMHLNFHGIDLYICLYCDYIHYDRLKIEAHQIRKHPFRIDCDNKFNIVAIRSKNPGLCTYMLYIIIYNIIFYG